MRNSEGTVIFPVVFRLALLLVNILRLPNATLLGGVMLKKMLFVVLTFIAAQSFAEGYGNCWGKFKFTDRSSKVYCKPEISKRECVALVEHHERIFKEKYKTFYYASIVHDQTANRNSR
jgi:hypothetical protein